MTTVPLRTLRSACVLACVLLTVSDPALAQEKPQPKQPAQRPTADLIRDAVELRKRGDMAQAAATFTTARRANDFAASKPPPELIFAIGDFHFAQGSLESQNLAIETYDLALSVWGRELSPFHVAQMRTRRAEVLSWQGKLDLAREEINALRTVYKDDRRVNLLVDLAAANLLLLSNQAEAARDALKPLTELNDDVITPAAMFALGRAYVQLKQPDQAVATFRTLWNRHGESAFVKRAVYLIGQVYFDRGDFLEARKLYEACAVVGASMQTRVRPGDDLIVKVSDPDYFARTRAITLDVTLTAPSGDEEKLRLEKNPVSDQLYVGRIQTALLMPKPGDGQLQIAGSDVLTMSYVGQSTKPYEVRVVDDGAINIDSVELPAPRPRNDRSLPAVATAPRERVEPIVLPTGKLSSGAVSAGSSIYVQIIDADFDVSAKPDTAVAEVLAVLKGATTDSVKVTLTETGDRTGVFTGTVATEPLAADAKASSESEKRPAFMAIDGNSKTSWKAKPGSLKDGQKHFIEIDLRQPAELGTLTWGPTESGMANTPTATRVILRGDGVDVTLDAKGKPKATDNTVDLKKTFARTVRLEFDAFQGDAPAVGQLVITDSAGTQLVPTGVDPDAPERKEKLAFDVGYEVFARFTDEENESPGSNTTRESRRLGVRYHDASVSLASVAGEGAARRVSPAWRLEREGRQQIAINDADVDTTIKPDAIKVTAFGESGDSQQLSAEETGPATGAFVAALPLGPGVAAKENPRMLQVEPGDLVWFTYLDDRNITPGYRTFRHHWVLENRPTVGDFASQSLVTTAWPFEVKPAADGEMQAIPRQIGKGRVQVQFTDGDAFADATRLVTARIHGLVGQTSTEAVLQPTGPGTATATIDLVLGDKESAGRFAAGQEDAGQDGKAPAARPGVVAEIAATGDDIIRIAATDELVASSDLVVRPVMSEGDLTALLAAPVDERTKDAVPVIALSDPLQRVAKKHEERLSALKAEMGTRLLASRLLAAQWNAQRIVVEAQLKAQAGNAERVEALKRQLVAVDAQLEMIKSRAAHLATLGAVEAKEFPPPPVERQRPVADPVAAIVDGPLVPGRPFQVLINDPDLKGEKTPVRLRSVAGRLVDVLKVDAARQADGTYAVRVETQRSSEAGEAQQLSLLPGGEVIVDYQDATEPKKGAERVMYLALASDATVRSLNSNYVDEASQIRLGQEVHIEVVDYDADRTAGLDVVLVRARSARGDQTLAMLNETEPHSGIFRGMFKTDFAEPVKDDEILQAGYGGSIEIAYEDYLRLTPGAPITQAITVNVAGGSDGRIELFARQFQDTREEMSLWYRTGQAAYQVGRKLYLAGAMVRAEEHLAEATDYFHVLVTRFPDDPLAASSNYYLGNIQSLRGNHREALARFQEVVTRWPQSEFVARARFKTGQAYESLGQFEQAADAYVLLTYHHPTDEQVPLAMIRMMNHYARNEAWADAVAIAQRFVTKFPTHDQSGAVALKAGQWLTVSGRTAQALAWYTSAEKTFATSDRDMPALLYWHAATMIQGGQVGRQGQRADKIRECLNRVVYDYPRSEYAALARVAMEQIDQQN